MRCNMRWMSVILCATVLSLSAFAAEGAKSRLSYSSERIQLAQALSQPDTNQAADSALGMPTLQFQEGRMNPGKALMLSAIIPGAGQFYAKSPIFGGLFLAAEIAAWTGVASYHSKGMKRDDEFHAWADQYWIYSRQTDQGQYIQFSGDLSSMTAEQYTYLGYEYWVATTYGTNGSYTTWFVGKDPAVDDIVEWMTSTWDSRREHLPTGFTHHLDPDNKDQQYYEMIGKYEQFWAGWPSDGNYGIGSSRHFIDWGPYDDPNQNWIHNTYRDHYQDLRKQSNDALDMSKNFTMVVMGNHLLSALHAGFLVSLHNRKLNKEQKIEGSLQFEPRKYQDEHLAMASLKVKF